MAAIIFDLDGTLIDSAPDIHAAGNAAVTANGGAPVDFTTARRFIGRGAEVFVTGMMDASGVPSDRRPAVLKRFLELYETAFGRTTLYPNVARTLDVLIGQGHELGICTNKPEAPTRAVLAHFGLADRFRAIVGGDTLPVRKPDPATLVLSLAAMHGGPGVFVGDSEVDAETAAAAGAPFILFTRGYRMAKTEEIAHDATFDDHSELSDLIAALS